MTFDPRWKRAKDTSFFRNSSPTAARSYAPSVGFRRNVPRVFLSTTNHSNTSISWSLLLRFYWRCSSVFCLAQAVWFFYGCNSNAHRKCCLIRAKMIAFRFFEGTSAGEHPQKWHTETPNYLAGVSMSLTGDGSLCFEPFNYRQIVRSSLRSSFPERVFPSDRMVLLLLLLDLPILDSCQSDSALVC